MKAIDTLHKTCRPAPVTEALLDRYLGGELGKVTLGTFLAKTLKGKAKNYSRYYYTAMARRIDVLVDAGLAHPTRSVHGGVAYEWVE